MSTHTHSQGPSYEHNEPPLLERFIASRSRLTLALILIALGGVFLLQQADVIKADSSWWVIFIAIPGIVVLGSAIFAYLQANKLTSGVITQGIIGILLLVLSAIFIWDPTWSFTRGWNLEETFPFLKSMSNWWAWLLVIPGAVLIYLGVRRQAVQEGVVGAILCIIGFVFILNISWNAVWPLAIVAVGVWLLLFPRSSRRDS